MSETKSISDSKLLSQKYRPKQNLFKVNKNVRVKLINSKMTYSESQSHFSFGINSVSDFDFVSKSNSNSEPESESDFSSVFMNLDVCVFFILYLHSSK